MRAGITERLERELSRLSATDALRVLPSARFGHGTVEENGRQMINLSSNDYLSIASDRELEREFIERLRESEGVEPLMSSSSSRLLTGESKAYRELEATLSSLYGGRAAMVFSSGYHLNSGVLPALCDAKTLILADKLSHASIIDGIRMSECEHKRFRHNDMAHLERLLDDYAGKFNDVIVVTESVFSMDGDICPLRHIVSLKERYPNVSIYLDEAHGVGVFGEGGLGVAEAEGVLDKVDFIVGTMGKALGSCGAYLICDRVVKEYLVNKVRPFIFTTGLPPVTLMWSRFVIERLASMNDRRKRLARVGGIIRDGLASAGMPTVSESQIIPVVAGSCGRSVELARKLREEGFYLLPIRPPTVPEGASRVRVSLNASLSEEDAEKLLSVIKRNI